MQILNRIILVLLAYTIFPMTTNAGIKNGTYLGINESGDKCEMVVTENYFLNNQKHPLNERIKVEFNNSSYVIQHPPLVSVSEVSAFFDHDHFHGVLAAPKGGLAIVIKMSHSPNGEGPTELYQIDHEYKSNKRTLTMCLNLKLKE